MNMKKDQEYQGVQGVPPSGSDPSALAPLGPSDQGLQAPNAPAHEPEKESGQCKGWVWGYHPWARSASGRTYKIGDAVIEPNKWTRLDEHEWCAPDVAHVPVSHDHYPLPMLMFHGMVSLEAAEALRWHAHAHLGKHIETRITRHKIAYEFTQFDSGETAPVKQAEFTTQATKP